MSERRKTKKVSTGSKVALVLAIILMIFAGIIAYAHTLMNTGKIYKNVFINSVDVSNLSVEEAKSILGEKFKFGTLTLNNAGNSWTQGLSELGFSYDIDSAVDTAYKLGREGNFVSNALKVFALNFGAEEFIELKANEDYTKLEDFYNNVASAVNSYPIDASISIQSGNISVTPSQDGYVVDMEKLRADVQAGLQTDEDKIFAMDIPVAVTKANVQAETLSSINGVIATYTTKYPVASAIERAFNVELTAKKLNNQLLMPGQEMSFMTILGDVSVSNGFKVSKVIINNEYQDGIGGGVCQVSSTLYNALLLGGVDVTTRVNHSLPVGYVPIGRDATVATGWPDMKYRNNYDFPIYIKTLASNGMMTAQIYGDTSKSKKVEVYSEVTETIAPTVVYKNDPQLPLGKEEVEQEGNTGYTSVTYKIVDGQKTVISRDKYQMNPKIIKTGIGPAEVTAPAVIPAPIQAVDNPVEQTAPVVQGEGEPSIVF